MSIERMADAGYIYVYNIQRQEACKVLVDWLKAEKV
jgi:hypothetical protein